MISRRRHAQIHLPPMTGEQAYLLAAALERHHAMLDRLDQRSAKRASTDAQRHEHDPDDADLPW